MSPRDPSVCNLTSKRLARPLKANKVPSASPFRGISNRFLKGSLAPPFRAFSAYNRFLGIVETPYEYLRRYHVGHLWPFRFSSSGRLGTAGAAPLGTTGPTGANKCDCQACSADNH